MNTLDVVIKAQNPYGEEVILTQSTWENIIKKHPEVKDHLQMIEKTIDSPDFIKNSIYDIRSKLYYAYYSEIYNGKYLVVVVKSVDKNFVSTSYITDEIIKGGDIVWTKL